MEVGPCRAALCPHWVGSGSDCGPGCLLDFLFLAIVSASRPAFPTIVGAIFKIDFLSAKIIHSFFCASNIEPYLGLIRSVL